MSLACELPLKVMAAVGEIEGLIDEREIRHDVADDGVLEHRPVLPGRVVRVAAADVPAGPASSATHTGPRQPSIRPAPIAPSSGARTGVRCDPSGQLSENVLDQTTGLLQLVEPDCNACGYITVGAATFSVLTTGR